MKTRHQYLLSLPIAMLLLCFATAPVISQESLPSYDFYGAVAISPLGGLGNIALGISYGTRFIETPVRSCPVPAVDEIRSEEAIIAQSLDVARLIPTGEPVASILREVGIASERMQPAYAQWLTRLCVAFGEGAINRDQYWKAIRMARQDFTRHNPRIKLRTPKVGYRIMVDGQFFDNTNTTIVVEPGQHTLSIRNPDLERLVCRKKVKLKKNEERCYECLPQEGSIRACRTED